MATYYASGFISAGGIFQAPTADGAAGQVMSTDGSGQLALSPEIVINAGVGASITTDGTTMGAARVATIALDSPDDYGRFTHSNNASTKTEWYAAGSLSTWDFYGNSGVKYISARSNSGTEGLWLKSGSTVTWSSGNIGAAHDLYLYRAAAGALGVYTDTGTTPGTMEAATFANGTTAQTAIGNATGGVTVYGDFTATAATSTSEAVTFACTQSWIDSTHATRKGQVEHKVYDTAARTVARDFADGTNGYRALKVLTTAPADASLSVSEVVFYTDGSGNFLIKLKDSGGTVRTGSVTLS